MTEIELHLRVKRVQAELSIECGGLCLNDWTFGHILIMYARTCETYGSRVLVACEAILVNSSPTEPRDATLQIRNMIHT